MRATIITDASWNPSNKAAGWACWIRYDDQQLIRFAAEFKSPMISAGRAEYCAVINSIALAIKSAKTELTSILVQTDCMDVVMTVKRKGRSLIMQELPTLTVPDILIRHVKGHVRNPKKVNHWCNNWCDAEAKKKMREASAKC